MNSSSVSKKTNNSHTIIYFVLVVIVLLVDLLSKYLVIANFSLYESINLLPVLNFTYVQNHGAAFSFLAAKSGWQTYFFIILSSLISLYLIYLILKSKDTGWSKLAYAFILGGALGNLFDRIYNGYVIDFIHVFYENYHFPVFNIADSAITIGAILLIFELLIRKK